MSITNRIAAKILGAIVARIPERPEAGTGRRVEDAPPVWRYTIRDADTGEPYMTRVVFPRFLGIRPLLHHIHRPDYARSLHNHPWRWSLSTILAGSYDEDRMVGQHRVTRRVRFFNWIRDRDYHAIRRCRGEVFTLFVSGPRSQSWGFLVGDQHVPHEQYELLRKVDTATGADLDAIGELVGVRRRRAAREARLTRLEVSPGWYATRYVQSPFDGRPEDDYSYRRLLQQRRLPGEEIARPRRA